MNNWTNRSSGTGKWNGGETYALQVNSHSNVLIKALDSNWFALVAMHGMIDLAIETRTCPLYSTYVCWWLCHWWSHYYAIYDVIFWLQICQQTSRILKRVNRADQSIRSDQFHISRLIWRFSWRSTLHVICNEFVPSKCVYLSKRSNSLVVAKWKFNVAIK